MQYGCVNGEHVQDRWSKSVAFKKYISLEQNIPIYAIHIAQQRTKTWFLCLA